MTATPLALHISHRVPVLEKNHRFLKRSSSSTSSSSSSSRRFVVATASSRAPTHASARPHARGGREAGGAANPGGADPQVYGLGIKEVWQGEPEKHKPGSITHTMGWPLDMET